MYKIVNENINEFQKGFDPVDSLFDDIKVGDLVTDRYPYTYKNEYNEDVVNIDIFVVSNIFAEKKEVKLYMFLYGYVINGKMGNDDMYVSGDPISGLSDIASLRKLNIKERQIIHNNLKEFSKAANRIEKRINRENKINITVRL